MNPRGWAICNIKYLVTSSSQIFKELLTVCVKRFAMWLSFRVDSSQDQVLERTYREK